MLIFFAATCLLSGSGVAAPVMAPAADSTGAELHWVDPANLPDGELKRQLEALEPAARRRALETLGTFPLLESGLRWLRVSPSGDVLTIDPAPPVSVAEQKAAAALLAQQIAAAGTARQKAAAAAAGGGRVVNGLWAFELHSRPSAARRLLLDFDGHVTTGALMNQAVGIDPIVSAPWDPAGDGPAFSEGELGIVYHIWQDISEEFAALDLDVTTEDSGNEDARCVISTTDWIGDGGTGGISFLGGFGGAYRTSPAFIFAQYYSGVKEWSDTAAHECAHLLGLGHDGGPAGPWVGSPDYYEGHASATGGWGPIMGVPRNRAVSQWSRGEYYGFLNPQGQTPLDDFALMASKTGYVPDEVGNDTASAVPLVTDGSTSVSVTGMVGPNGDVDMFSMDVTSGVVNLTVYPYPMDAAGNDPYHGANLDILVSLYNAAGELIGSYNPADKLWAALTGVSLPAPGRYYLSVQGTGVGTPLANPPSGYTAYGSVGRYTIGGTIPPAPPSDVQLAVDNGGGATIPPSAKTAARLQGTLAGGPAAVFVCWGAADGGTNATAWQHVVSLGALSDGAFATNVTGLTYGRRYYYRCTATNADGRAWAPATTAFVSRRPALEVTDGLVLWLDADQLGLSDGESVASFTDSSGAGHAASNGVAGTFKANIINGRPVVRFTTSQYLYTSASFVRPYTMLHVAKMNGGISARLISAADGNRLFGYHGTYRRRCYLDGWMADSTTPAGTNAHLYAFTVTNGASSMWEDGTNIALNSGASADIGRLRLNGLGAAGPSENSDGDVAEVLIYNTVLSRDDERRVGSYLAAKYGLPTAYTYPACIVNGAASGVTATSVVLNATLAGADAVYDVRAYWGAANGGTNVGAWALSALVGSYTNVASTNLTHLAAGLASNAAFFYTFRATNLVEDVWASPSVAFLTAGVHVEATDAVAWEQIANPGAFTVFRPPALTNGDLTVNYTLGGTATNGRDYAALSGSVVIPAGADRATIPVVPIDNDVIEDDRTVVLTLAPGGYLIGAPGSATVTIRERAVFNLWARKALLTFTNDSAIGRLTNFPVLVKLGPGVIPGFDYGQFASSNGYDLRFVDAARTRYLSYEIDRWDTNGESFVWVHMPLLTGSGDTLWAYWGLPAATNPAPFAGNGAAWDPDFRGVWHLNADLRDSTVNGNHGVDNGTTASTGVVGLARAFDGTGNHRIDCGAAASLQVSGAFTISFWMAPGTLAGDAPLVALAWPGWNGNNLDLIFNLSLRGNALRFDYGWTDGGLLYSLWWQYGGYVQAGEVGQWTHVALTYAGDRMTMYKNGAIIADWPTGHFPLKNYGGVFHIGHWPQNAEYGGVFNGRLDELRFAHTARSAGWIRACWLSQKPDSTFITYGRALYVVPQTGGVLIVR